MSRRAPRRFRARPVPHRRVCSPRARGGGGDPRLFALARRRRQKLDARQRTPGAFKRRVESRADLLGRRAFAAADPRHDHGFTHSPLRHRHGRAPSGLAADAVGARNGDARERAAERGLAGDQQSLGLERHGVGDEPPAGLERRDCRIEHAGFARAAADEDRVGRGETGESFRRAPLHDFELGHAEGSGVAPDALRRGRRGPRSPRRAARDAPASIRWRSSRSRRRCPTAIRPRSGASDDSVTARISRLVICPSCSNRSSAKSRRVGDDCARPARPRPRWRRRSARRCRRDRSRRRSSGGCAPWRRRALRAR